MLPLANESDRSVIAARDGATWCRLITSTSSCSVSTATGSLSVVLVNVWLSSVPPLARIGVIQRFGLPVVMFQSSPQTFFSGWVSALAAVSIWSTVQVSAGGATPICRKSVLLYVQSNMLSWKGTASSLFS